MGDVPSGGERLHEQLIRAMRLALPEQTGTVLAQHVGLIGGRDATLYLVDYQQVELVPLPVDGRPAEPVLPVAGSVAGRAFTSYTAIETEVDGGVRLWMPVTDGVERTGMLALTADALDELFVVRARSLAGLLAEVITTKTAFGDALEVLRRREPMSLAAEMLWRTLPPLTVGSPSVVLSGSVNPVYDVGGDAFDYSIDAGTAHLAVVDGMGHGLAAGLLASVGTAAYRRARRMGADLLETVQEMDAAVSEQFGLDRFLTAVVAQLDVESGLLSWVNAGHPPPLLVRGRRVVKELEAPPGPPIGVGLLGSYAVATESLEPGDRVLLYTDGVIEARNAEGEFFGLDRLSEVVAREAASALAAPEVLRRLSLSVLEHQAGILQDDATVVLLEWLSESPLALLP